MSTRTRPLRPSDVELAVGLRTLATLLASALPLGRVLDTFETVAPRSWRPSVVELRSSVRNGSSLSAALESSSLVVPPPLVGLIRAGEARGALADGVGQAAALAAQQARARQAIASALAYPILLVVAGLGTLAIMVLVVLPRFATLLGEADVAIPRSTKIMLSLGAAGRAWAIPASIMLVAAVALTLQWLREPANRITWHAFLLSLPFVGDLRLRFASGRLCGLVAGLVGAGVPLVRSLEIAAGAMSDRCIAERTTKARQAIMAGSGAAAALRGAGVLTEAASRLVTAGEASGRMCEMLNHAATIDVEAATEAVRAGARVIEPALVVVIGGLIAMMAAALLQTIYAIRP